MMDCTSSAVLSSAGEPSATRGGQVSRRKLCVCRREGLGERVTYPSTRPDEHMNIN